MTNNDKVLKLIFHYWNRTVTEEVLINDELLALNLVQYINQYDSEINEVTFDDNYKHIAYENYKQYPYIRRKDIVEWNVAYEAVCIGDFIRTFPEVKETGIHTYIDNRGGAGDIYNTFVQEWSNFFNHVYDTSVYLNYLGDTIDWISRIIFVCKGIKWLKKSFSNKIEKKPSVNSLKYYICRNETWDILELSKILKADKIVLKNILDSLGYVTADEKIYRYDRVLADKIRKKEEGTENMYMSQYTCGQIDYIVKQLNEQVIYYAVLWDAYIDGRRFEEKIEKMLLPLREYMPYIKWDKHSKSIKILDNLSKDFDERKQNDVMTCLQNIYNKIESEIWKSESNLD